MIGDLFSFLTSSVFEGFLTASMRLAIPIMLTAIGGIYNERAGISNIGMEGFMIVGSLTGFVASYYSGSVWIGILAAIFLGILLGLIMGYFEITLKVNQVVFGISLNLFCVGLTSFLFRVIFGITSNSPRITPLPTIVIPVLSKIPVIGPILFQQTALAYITYILVLITAIIMYRSAWGMNIIAAGENPEAAETMGVDVIRTRYYAIIISGVLCSIGGAFLSTASTGLFVQNMTAGRGYIALAILVIGRWDPFGVFVAALLFGAADALQLRTQLFNFNIPYQFLVMLPYVLCMIVMIFFSKSSRAPAALGEPYDRGGKKSEI